MANLTGGSFKRINASDIKTRKTSLNQLVDIIQEDISGSNTRRAYQVFITGGVGPGVTSSLYQTVYDQNFTLQTANPLFDMTVGIYSGSSTVANISTPDGTSKLLFPSTSIMMREKIDVYRQHSAHLLNNPDGLFTAPFESSVVADQINHALFLNFKRLFVRDGVKRETFAIKLFRSASQSYKDFYSANPLYSGRTNVFTTSHSGSAIFSDIGATSPTLDSAGGPVGNIKNASNSNETVGLIFYEKGAIVLDMEKVFSGTQHMSGTIPAMATSTTNGGETISAGFTVLGSAQGNRQAKFIPDFITSASIDTIVDHIATTRFSSGTLTSATFQNQTNINSTLIFCRATADEFNYSSNPTYADSSTGKLVVIDTGQEDTQRSFTFPTTVGLHDQFGNLLAVAKMSRPIEKNDEKDVTFRIRLDF